ncbi:MAG TPA: hypothetical protein VIL74_09005 [Pyrinomonadaceae bacterium]|jgi:predicted Zn-ribbon and HTH transcriptional regulator
MPLDAGKTKKQKGALNFAPVESLRRLKDRPSDAYEESGFHSFVRDLHNDIANRNIEVRRQAAEIGRLMSNLRTGKEMLKRDPIHGNYALIKPTPQRGRSDRHIVPLAQVNSSQLTSIWTLSRPRATVRHFGNTTRAQIQHALVEQVIGHYDAEIFDELFHQQESLSMMDYGTVVIHPYYDDKLNSILEIQPVIENRPTTLFEGYGFCDACGYEAAPEDFMRSGLKEMPQCPECRSYIEPDQILQAVALDLPEVIGQRQIRQGDLGAELRPLPACNWDYRYMIQDSPYSQYKAEVSLRFVESVLGLEVAEESSDDDFGLHVMNAMGLRGGSVEGYGRENLYGYSEIGTRTCVMVENHFLPEFYAGTRFRKEEKTVSGEVIPAGVPLEQIFPDGLLTIGFNDFDILAGAYNEPRRTVSCVYHIQSHSGIGKGTSDAIEVGEQLNDAHSAALAALKRYGAGGGVAYDAEILTQAEAQKLLKPAGLVGIKGLAAKGYTQVEQVIKQIQNNELNQSNLAMIAQLTNMMNVCFQTTDFTSGVADNRVDVNTLGGQQLLQAQNQQRSAAPLRMKGWGRARVFERLIELFRENIEIPKFFGSSDRFALVKGKFITGADMPEKVKCDFISDSEIPQNTFTKRENAQLMLEKSANFGVSFVELVQINPRIAVWWANYFGVSDMPLMNQTEILMVCQDRIDNLKELAQADELIQEISGFYTDPNQTAAEIVATLDRPLSVSEENHAVKAQVIAEYLDDDEVKEWSPLMRAAVEALIQQHYKFDRDQRFRTPALDQEGQMMLAGQANGFQQQMMAPQIEQENRRQVEQQALALEGEQMQKRDDMEMERARAEEDFARDEDAKQRDHERARDLEAMRLKSRSEMSGGKKK